jgi:hypothetical protein
VAQNYAPVSLTFLDAFDRDKCEVEATIHAAHRVNHICFHLMQNDEPFQDRSTPQLEAERARRWRQFKAKKSAAAADVNAANAAPVAADLQQR